MPVDVTIELARSRIIATLARIRPSLLEAVVSLNEVIWIHLKPIRYSVTVGVTIEGVCSHVSRIPIYTRVRLLLISQAVTICIDTSITSKLVASEFCCSCIDFLRCIHEPVIKTQGKDWGIQDIVPLDIDYDFPDCSIDYRRSSVVLVNFHLP